MSKEEYLQSENRPEAPKGADVFDTLSKVIEQDGVVLSTPSGIKRYVQKRVCVKPKPVFEYKIQTHLHDEAASVENLDVQVVSCLVTRHEPAKVVDIPVKHEPVARSPFVVSLRETTVRPEEKQVLAPVADQLAFSETLAVPLSTESLRSLSDQALSSKHEPWQTAGQITNPSKNRDLKFKLAWRDGVLWFKGLLKSSKPVADKVKAVEAKTVAVVGQELEGAAELAQSRRFSLGKAALGFVMVALVMTLPAQALVAYRVLGQDKDNIESQSREAVNALSGISQNQDIGAVAGQLQQASGLFRQADVLLDRSHGLAIAAAAVAPSGYRSAKALLEVGEKTSAAAGLLATGLNSVFQDKDRDLVERVEALGTYARGAAPLLADAERAAATVDADSMPQDKREQIRNLSSQIHDAAQAVREFELLSDLMVNVLGKNRARTYLLVFQNDTELRPSGGFIGSLAEIEVDRGRIASVYVPKGGPYDLKSQLTVRLQSPKPLQLINPLWQFQDANWFADFPTTAEKLRWFWGKSGQPSVDGVVAINSSLMPRILEVTGPIDMPQYGKRIDAQNFLLETQKSVELEYDKQENAPKKFVGDLFQALMERSKNLSREELLKLAAVFSDALETKDVQIAMVDPDEEALIEKFGWNGRFKSSIGDSLAIVGANIAGQKTDGVIDEKVSHTAEIQDDGSIVDTLVIQRTHNGSKGELFRGVRNVQYLRVYVPKGSELLAAQGFETPATNLFKKVLETDAKDPDLEMVERTAVQATGTIWQATESDRSVFGGWLQLDPGQSQTVTLKYRLPMGAYDILSSLDAVPQNTAAQDGAPRGAYLLLATSQSGKSRYMKHEVRVSPAWKAVWQRGSVQAATDVSSSTGSGAWEGTWDRDRVTASLYALNQPPHETTR